MTGTDRRFPPYAGNHCVTLAYRDHYNTSLKYSVPGSVRTREREVLEILLVVDS